jgi:pyruvate/2-oxoacid:ferredoxin oxidoreductase alpha subunit
MARTQVMCAYPITPQTSIVEELAEMVASGQLDSRFIKVESEHSSMAGCIAAASTGVRTFTASSSHGLALMHEMLHWAAGARLPIVMVNVNRGLGPGWSLWADQSDSLAQRDTGWMQVYCQSCQEVFDTVIQAFEVSQRVLLPSMVMLDGFFLSHTYEDVDLPEPGLVDSFLSPLNLPHKIDLQKPAALGSMVSADRYMEFRKKIDLAHHEALDVWTAVDSEWKALTGRSYGLVEEYRMEGAELVLVATATPASTAHAVVDSLHRQGIPAGLLRLRVFRPFPADALRHALKNRKKVVVLDRSCSYGHHGAFHQEVKSALYELPAAEHPEVKGVIAGLGGRDITAEDLEEMLLLAWRDKLAESVTWWNTLPEAAALLVSE